MKSVIHPLLLTDWLGFLRLACQRSLLHAEVLESYHPIRAIAFIFDAFVDLWEREVAIAF